jgi:hypothetical protein
MPLSDEDMYKMFGPTSCAPDEMKTFKQKIYFIVAYCTYDKKHRCFGYYRTLEDARAALKSMWKDIEECYYDSFFIESMEEGIHKIGEFVEYYEIDMLERKLVLKNKPTHLHGIINWAIG